METTRAYYMSHILLRNKIFFEVKEFKEKLHQGPQVMKQYLLELWDSIDESLVKEGVMIKDLNREVTVNDFDIVARKKEDKTIFFFMMPEPDSYDAQAKIVALVISENQLPRYITMEIWSQNEMDNMKQLFGDEYVPQYTIGEWVIKENQFTHVNLGRIPEGTWECFATYLGQKILN